VLGCRGVTISWGESGPRIQGGDWVGLVCLWIGGAGGSVGLLGLVSVEVGGGNSVNVGFVGSVVGVLVWVGGVVGWGGWGGGGGVGPIVALRDPRNTNVTPIRIEWGRRRRIELFMMEGQRLRENVASLRESGSGTVEIDHRLKPVTRRYEPRLFRASVQACDPATYSGVMRILQGVIRRSVELAFLSDDRFGQRNAVAESKYGPKLVLSDGNSITDAKQQRARR